MRCPSCQRENRAGAELCSDCGQPLLRPCPRCGTPQGPESNFCDRCGLNLKETPSPEVTPYTPRHLAQEVLPSAGALEGERRQVTVLFADASGFTTLSERMDPEDVHSIMNRCFELVMREIHRFEGTINQFTGDGVMALFGAPHAHENSPQRAIQAALAIQEQLKSYAEELRKEKGIDFHMRMGINTGMAVVGSIGDSLRMDYTAVGDTTNLAARLETMAEPGTILVSDYTYQLTKDFFAFKPLGQKRLKGRQEPVAVYEVTGAKPVRSRLEVLEARGLTPFQDRERELKLLTDTLEKALGGKSRVVDIEGEAGIGKSRLIYEFKTSIKGENLTFLEGRCFPHWRNIAYRPFDEILGQYCELVRREHLLSGGEECSVAELLGRRLGSVTPALKGALPRICNLMQGRGEEKGLAGLEGEDTRALTFQFLRALFIHESRLQPLVLVLDDLQWLDSSSVALLKYLVEEITDARLIIITAYRPEFTPPWRESAHIQGLPLEPLPERSSSAMVCSILGVQKLHPEVEALIVGRAEGNPFFIEELTRSLQESGALGRGDGICFLVDGQKAPSVPNTVQEVIMERIDRLDHEAKALLQRASVIGRRFELPLLERVSLEARDIREEFVRLCELELIYEVERSSPRVFIFKHNLTQQIVYESLLRRRLHELHRRVGEALEEVHGDNLQDYYGELAHHFSLGEEREKAVHYLTLAGRRALALHSNPEAASSFQEALRILDELTPSPEARSRRLELQLDLGWALIQQGYQDERVLSLFESAEGMAKQLGDHSALAELYSRLSTFYFRKGDQDRVIDYSLRSSQLAEEVGSETLRLNSSFALGSAYFLKGRFRESIAAHAPAVRAFEEQEGTLSGRPGYSLRAYIMACGHLGASYGYRGEWVRGMALGRRALTRAKALQDPVMEGVVHLMLNFILACQGRWEEALVSVETAYRLAEKSHLPTAIASFSGHLGYALFRRGESERGQSLIEESIRLKRELREEFGLSICYTYLGEVHLAERKWEEALRCGEEALSLAEAHDERFHLAHAHRLTGEVKASLPSPDWALSERHFMRALRLLKEAGARPDLGRTLRAMGKMYAARGESRRAAVYRARALRVFRELNMPRDHEEAEGEEATSPQP